MWARWGAAVLAIAAPASIVAQVCNPTCDMTGSGGVSGDFDFTFKVQDSISGCPDRVCFEVPITNVGQYSCIGVSLAGTSMGSFEKLVVGRVGTTPYVYHAAPGGGYANPTSAMLASDTCITQVTVTASSSVRFSRLLDGSQCQAVSPILTATSAVNFATAVGAFGSGSAASGSISQHPNTPGTASTTMDSTTTSTATSTGAKNEDRAAHGTIMLVAWVLLATIGVFDMRYMRGLLNNNGLFFEVHFYIMMSVALLTIVGIAFMANKTESNLSESEWSGNKEHQRLGIATLALVLAQALLGLGRNFVSGKDSNSTDKSDHGPHRWIFNILHAVLGVTTWAVACGAIYQGIELLALFDTSLKEEELKNMLVVWAIIIVVIFFGLDIVRFLTNTMDKFDTPNDAIWYTAGAAVVVISVVCVAVIGSGISQ